MTISNVTAGGTIDAAWGNSVTDFLNGAVGFAWTDYTPTIDQGASTNIAKTTVYSKYVKVGRIVVWAFSFNVTGSGTAANRVEMTLPVQAGTANGAFGAGQIFDASTNTRYAGAWETAGSSSTRIVCVGDWSGTQQWGSTPSIALANGDAIRGLMVYESLA